MWRQFVALGAMGTMGLRLLKFFIIIIVITHLKVVLDEGEGEEDLGALLATLDGVVPVDHTVHLAELEGGPAAPLAPTPTSTTLRLDGVGSAVVELCLKV